METSIFKQQDSLAVLPKDYVIVAKRKSEGGELQLVKKTSDTVSIICPECDTRTKKGRVSIIGPLAELINITGVKTKHNISLYKTAGTRKKSHGAHKQSKRRTSYIYQQYQLDIIGLKPSAEAKYEPILTKKAKSTEELHPEPQQAERPIPTKVQTEEHKLTEEERPEGEPSSSENTLPVIEFADLRVIKKEKGSERKVAGEGKGLKSRFLQQISKFSSVLPVPLHSIPKLSVLVKWKQHPNIPCYTGRSVYDALSKYGIIVAMGQLSVNSCLVLFENFHSAVLVVRDSLIGPRAYPLICMWYYPHMYLNSIDLLDIHPYKKHVAISEEAKWLQRFREMQNQVIACFKTRGAGISYNRATFKP